MAQQRLSYNQTKMLQHLSSSANDLNVLPPMHPQLKPTNKSTSHLVCGHSVDIECMVITNWIH